MAKHKATRVVIVGGGFGGIKTALELANKSGFLVTLISDNTHFEYHGALYRSAVGHSPMEVVIPLREIFAKARNVTLELDNIGFIDPKKHILGSLTGNTYTYDKVIFALGNTVNYFGIKGLADHTESMSNINGTIQLRSKLVSLFREKHHNPLRIAVVGAGASGVELAAELPNFARSIAHAYHLPKPKLNVVLVDGSDRVLPLLQPSASKKAARKLQKIGVEVHLNMQVKSCKKNVLQLHTGDLAADLIVWTAGSKPVDFYEKHPDCFTLGRGGRVIVDEYLRVAKLPNVYVIGDNADTKYSGMAQTALYNAMYVARSLMAEKANKPIKPYRNRKPIYVVTVGPKWAVAQAGNRVVSGKAGWSVRRQADLAIFKHFKPYKEAIKTWRKANKMVRL